MKDKIKDIIGMSVVGVIVLLIVFGLLFFFGGTILSVLGLEYDNLWTLSKFFAIYMIVSTPLDFIIECFFKVMKDLKGLSEIQHAVFYGFIDILTNTILIGILEHYIDGIKCSALTALIFSIIIFILNYNLEKKANS